MAVIGRRNHALAFNGVNDSIIIPQGRMTRLGQATTEGTKSPLPILGESAHGTKDGDGHSEKHTHTPQIILFKEKQKNVQPLQHLVSLTFKHML